MYESMLKEVIDDIKRPILIGNNQILKSTEDMIRAYIMLSIDKKEEIDITITSFLSATQDAESPWKKYYLSLSTT